MVWWYMCYVKCCFFFFKQKTAYEMRISDWSSDVCSSDLVETAVREAPGEQVEPGARRHRGRDGDDLVVMFGLGDQALGEHLGIARRPRQIGRASCRERVCQYV